MHTHTCAGSGHTPGQGMTEAAAHSYPAPPRPRAGLVATGQLLFCICLSLADRPGFPESRSSRVCPRVVTRVWRHRNTCGIF